MKRILLNWVPFISFAVVIFFLSSRPNLYPPIEIDHIDLLAHAMFYAIFAVLLARALQLKIKPKVIKYSLIVIAVASCYGALNEWYQMYVPNRYPSVLDGIANFIGAITGVAAYVGYYNFYKIRS